MATATSNGDFVQRLFEEHLGPARTLPDVVAAAASSAGAGLREKERTRFRVARGIALDCQAVPATGTLLGVTYQPPRPAALCMPKLSAQRCTAVANRDEAGQAAVPTAPAAAGDGALEPPLVSLRGLGAVGAPTPAPAPAAPDPQPAHATLWALVQPAPSVGVNTALSAVDAATGFGGWHQDGFLDLSRRAGIDYSVCQHPGSGLAAELDLQATLPKLLPLLPELTAQHRMAGEQARPGVQHTSTLTAQLLRGAAQARLRVAESASDPDGALVTFELQGRSNGGARGLAGGARLQPELTTAFFGSDGKAASRDAASSDSDDEDGASRANGKGGARRANTGRVPGLRLQLAPAVARSWEDASGHWRQSWGGRLRSMLGYQGRQRRWNLELASKLTRSLSASGTLVYTGPAHAAPAIDAVDLNGSSAVVAGSSGGSGFGSDDGGSNGGAGAISRVQALQRRASAYVGASRLCRAGMRLAWRPQATPRQLLRLETSLSEGGELSHTLRYRLGGGAQSDSAQQRARADVALAAQPAKQLWELKFDVFAPL